MEKDTSQVIEKETSNQSKMQEKNKKTIKYYIKEWVPPILCAVVLAFVINKFLFFNINVPTGSMIPTIMPNDRIVVTRVHNTDKLERGDIVVFHSEELQEDLIKRLIGLPGDIVERKKDGTVYVNGEKSDEDYIEYDGGAIGKFEVPEGHFLFFGDNRANSYDARRWNNPYISEDNIMGKAQVVIFPFNRIGKLR